MFQLCYPLQRANYHSSYKNNNNNKNKNNHNKQKLDAAEAAGAAVSA